MALKDIYGSDLFEDYELPDYVLERLGIAQAPVVAAPVAVSAPVETKVSDADILGWFNANPGADDALIASTMQAANVTPEQVARATNTNYEDVNARYLAATGATKTGGIADLVTPTTPTFTDTIKTTPTDDTTTNQVTEWNAPVDLGDGTFMTPGGTIIDSSGYPVDQTADSTDTAADIVGPTTYTKNFAGQSYTLDNAAVDFLVNQILGQNLTSQWQGEGFGSPQANARAMAENLLASGITDINQVGQITKKVDETVIPVYDYVLSGYGDDQQYTPVIVGYVDSKGNPVDASLVKTDTAYIGEGSAETVYTAPVGTQNVIGNKVTGQQIINDYGERGVGNAFSGTYAGSGNTAYRVQFDAKGNPYFYTTGASSSDIADWGPILSLAAVIPSPLQPFAIAANAAIAIDNNDIFGGIAALAGLAGFTDVAAGARIAKAVDSQDPFAIVTSVMNSPFGGDVGGTMLTDTISLKDAGNALNLANNVANENWAAALTSANQLVNSPDLATAAAAARFIKAAETNNFAGMYTAANGFNNAINAANKITDKDVALNIANSVADANSAATEGTQLASLASDTMSDAGNGFTLTGDGGSTLNFPDFTGSESINADADLFNSSIGDLDAIGNITDTTGLDMGDVIPDGGDGVEELVVTGTGDKDTDKTDTTNVTDTDVEDKGEVVIKDKKESCPVGTVLNPETGECDTVTDEGEIVIKDKKESCPVGTVLNPETGNCDPVTDEGEIVIKDKKESCPIGTVLNPETGNCDPIVETPAALDCPEGYEPNEAGTACIPVVVIKDTKCDPGFVYDEDLKQCVAIKGEDECPTGYHRDEATGQCVPDTTTLNCPEGYEPNEAGTACIPVVVIKDTKCDPGFVYDEDLKQCVPIEDEPCAEGFHLENGLCVPDDEGCKPGFEPVNGTCVPVCAEGYIRNLATGVCEKVEDKSCPVGQVRNAEGKCVPITKTTECQPGYERVNGVCVPIKKVVPPITPTGFLPSAAVSGEKTEPIYAGAMEDFNLFATLEELLKENSDKTDKKKDSKKSKEKTKMATGGHLDDLLAEQMTVDDLLKLLR